jgi:hypothetical protein
VPGVSAFEVQVGEATSAFTDTEAAEQIAALLAEVER